MSACISKLLGCCLMLLAAPVPALDLDRFDQDFVRLLEDDRVPGGAYAIVEDDRILRLAGHGRRVVGAAERVTPETVFRIASVSKPFAAHLTALLVEEGWLSWDEPLRRRLPEFRLADVAHSDQLQVRHILGQSAGVVPNAYDNLLDASQSLNQILPQFARLDPICRPGECYTYQNVLFSLIEPVIEGATDRRFEDLLEERIFQPLGMSDSSIGLEAYRASANRAMAHVRVSRHLPWVPAISNENYYRVAPAAGVNTSARDLASWLIAQLGHRPDLIGERALQTLTESRVRTSRELRRREWSDLLSNAHYALGWRVYQIGEDTLYLHSGWVRGFVAEVAYSRRREIGLAVLLNAESRALGRITTTFWRQVFEAEEPAPAVAVSEAANASSIAGRPSS
jgi:beta-lactamase class C